MTEHERRDRAARRERALKGWYSHLTLYLGVMLLLVLIDLFNGGTWWFFWPLLGWGVGVGAHARHAVGEGSLRRAG